MGGVGSPSAQILTALLPGIRARERSVQPERGIHASRGIIGRTGVRPEPRDLFSRRRGEHGVDRIRAGGDEHEYGAQCDA